MNKSSQTQCVRLCRFMVDCIHNFSGAYRHLLYRSTQHGPIFYLIYLIEQENNPITFYVHVKENS